MKMIKVDIAKQTAVVQDLPNEYQGLGEGV